MNGGNPGEENRRHGEQARDRSRNAGMQQRNEHHRPGPGSRRVQFAGEHQRHLVAQDVAQYAAEYARDQAEKGRDEPGCASDQSDLGADDGKQGQSERIRHQEQIGRQARQAHQHKGHHACGDSGNQVGLVGHPEHRPIEQQIAYGAPAHSRGQRHQHHAEQVYGLAPRLQHPCNRAHCHRAHGDYIDQFVHGYTPSVGYSMNGILRVCNKTRGYPPRWETEGRDHPKRWGLPSGRLPSCP